MSRFSTLHQSCLSSLKTSVFDSAGFRCYLNAYGSSFCSLGDNMVLWKLLMFSGIDHLNIKGLNSSSLYSLAMWIFSMKFQTTCLFSLGLWTLLLFQRYTGDESWCLLQAPYCCTFNAPALAFLYSSVSHVLLASSSGWVQTLSTLFTKAAVLNTDLLVKEPGCKNTFLWLEYSLLLPNSCWNPISSAV